MATTTFDFGALRRAHAERDPELLAALYTEDAELQIVDRNNPPSAPKRLLGRQAIQSFLAERARRETTRAIENEVMAGDRAAFNVSCEYEDGTRVLASTVAELRDGKIAREMTVQAWDG